MTNSTLFYINSSPNLLGIEFWPNFNMTQIIEIWKKMNESRPNFILPEKINSLENLSFSAHYFLGNAQCTHETTPQNFHIEVILMQFLHPIKIHGYILVPYFNGGPFIIGIQALHQQVHSILTTILTASTWLKIGLSFERFTIIPMESLVGTHISMLLSLSHNVINGKRKPIVY